MTKMLNSYGTILRSGHSYPFNCCGASYRKRSRVNDHLMVNKKGIFIIFGEAGKEGSVDGHTIAHVKTRFGTLTISTLEKHNAPRNLL